MPASLIAAATELMSVSPSTISTDSDVPFDTNDPFDQVPKSKVMVPLPRSSVDVE